MTTAGDLCSRTVIVIRSDEPLLEAARLMREHHVGDVVVVEETDAGRVPKGIVTDRDIVVDAVATQADLLTTLHVGDVMRKGVFVAGEHDRLGDVLKVMRSSSVRRMPVVSSSGTLVGVLSADDVLEFLVRELLDVAMLESRQRDREARRRG